MHKVVFLGTPEVVVQVFQGLMDSASGRWEIAAVVTQPPARNGRRGGTTCSPVQAAAVASGVPVMSPESARSPEFLEQLRAMEPDLCVTAAYGNFLPASFLSIPRRGTVNIHPSLLPLFRGAAPVQRAVEAGHQVTGVSLCMTVLAMDAGPLIHQDSVQVGSDESAPDLLRRLFALGTTRLVEFMPALLEGALNLQEQDHGRATHAKKVDSAEGLLDFGLPARILYNRYRAFSGWPGTRARLSIGGELMEAKIIRARCSEGGTNPQNPCVLGMVEESLRIRCGDGGFLDILEIQVPGKRALSIRDFWNGLKVKSVELAADATTCGSPSTIAEGSA